MLYHLTDIFCEDKLKLSFLSYRFPTQICFHIFYKYYSRETKIIELTKHALFNVIKLKLQKKKVKCDWMSLFNTNKKLQINREVDEWQSFFKVIVSNCGLSTYRKKWTLKCMLSWLLFGSCTCQEVRWSFLKNFIIFL